MKLVETILRKPNWKYENLKQLHKFTTLNMAKSPIAAVHGGHK